jgi:hypothetical protein
MGAQLSEAAADGSGVGAGEAPLPPIIIVEPFEETHGWPVRDTGVELPGERLPVLRVIRMLFMPWMALCEWPRLLLRSMAPGDDRPQR